jgi:hypothetical protein
MPFFGLDDRAVWLHFAELRENRRVLGARRILTLWTSQGFGERLGNGSPD